MGVPDFGVEEGSCARLELRMLTLQIQVAILALCPIKEGCGRGPRLLVLVHLAFRADDEWADVLPASVGFHNGLPALARASTMTDASRCLRALPAVRLCRIVRH